MVSLNSFQLKSTRMTPTEFQAKITNSEDLDFGTIFNQSIELFKKSWLQGFLMQLFVLILMVPFFIVLYVPIIMMAVSQAESGQFGPNDMNGLFAGLSALYVLFLIVGILIVGVIQIALTAGFYRMLRSIDHGLEPRTSDLFYFMKGKHLSKILLLMLVTLLISIPAALFFYLPFIYVLVPIAFFSIVFSFNPEWSVGDIVSSSFRIGNKKWLLTFGLFFVSYIAIMILTMVTCGLGGLFITAFMYHPIYYVYKATVGVEDSNELNQIGEEVVF